MPSSLYLSKAPNTQGSLCVASPHVVAPKSPPVVCWPAIGPWQSAIGVSANHKPQHYWQVDRLCFSLNPIYNSVFSVK